jgi:hypothetical protein
MNIPAPPRVNAFSKKAMLFSLDNSEQMVKCHIRFGLEVCPKVVFDNLAISVQHSAVTKPRFNVIRLQKNNKNGLRLSYDCLVELRLSLCLQQNIYPRVGSG